MTQAAAGRRVWPAAPTVSLLTTALGSTAGTTVVSPSISPSSNALIVVAFAMAVTTTTDINSASISSTLSNLGSWTVVRMTNTGSPVLASLVAYAKVTGAPGTGTVTVTTSSLSRRVLHVIEVLGASASAPVAQSKTGSTTTTMTVTLDAKPNGNHTILSATSVRSPATDPVVDETSGYTELAETRSVGTSPTALQTQYDRTLPAQSLAISSDYGLAINTMMLAFKP